MANPTFNIDFMGKRFVALGLSIFLVLGSIGLLAVQSLSWGLDFTGGTLVEVSYPAATDPQTVRDVLDGAGFENGIVQNFGTDQDILIRMPPQAPTTDGADAGLSDSILAALRDVDSGVEMRAQSFVGPAVGEELTESGGLAMIAALIVVMLYILVRFTGKFAIGAVVALAHDVLIVLGAFSLLRWTFDLNVLAAILAVIGYSLNDTIVVSDRIRENFRRQRKGGPVDVVNRSLNQTLGRTLVTSLTTLLVLVALLVAGGEGIFGFAVALTIGVVIGTYSSIYVAANILLLLKIDRQDLLVPEKENADAELMP
ncbi:MAG: protein translocase subunit SecF [Pseudomonadota bacterium]